MAGTATLGYTLVVPFRFAVLLHTGDGFEDRGLKREGLRLFKRLVMTSCATIIVWNVGRAVMNGAGQLLGRLLVSLRSQAHSLRVSALTAALS